MKKLFLLVLPLFLAGCVDDALRAGMAVHSVNAERNSHPEAHMTYFQDKNTKLCFASLDMPTITNVPCNVDVMKAIESKVVAKNTATQETNKDNNLSSVVNKKLGIN